MSDTETRSRRPFRLVLALLLMAVSTFVGPMPGRAAELGPEVRLLRSDREGVVLELETPDIEMVEGAADGAGCASVSAPGLALAQESGRPQLPVKVVLLGVPPDARLSLEAVPLQTAQASLAKTVCPAPRVGVRSNPDGRKESVIEAAPADPTVYAADRSYPAEVARLVELGFLRSQRIVRLELFPVQVNPLAGTLQHHQRMQVSLSFSGNTDAAFIEEPSEFEEALRGTLANYDSARAWRGNPDDAFRAPNAWIPPTPAYKVTLKQDGLYELSYAALQAAGLPVGTLDPRTLKLYNNGQEIAIRVTGEADARLDPTDSLMFYGQAINTRYTDTNVYWLTYGGAKGLRMAGRPSQSVGPEAVAFRNTVHLEQNLNYIPSLPKQPGYDHWYGQRIDAFPAGTPRWRDYPVSLSRVASGSATASLEVQLAGNIDGVHHLRLYVNGQKVHDGSWSGRTLYRKSVDFPQTLLAEGNNTIRVELANDTPGQAFDQIFVDWLEVSYQRTYRADGDQLAFGGDATGPQQYRLTGFTTNSVEVFDVTDAARVGVITNPTVTADGATYTVRFGDDQATPRRYLALTPAQRRTPLGIEADTPSSLQSPGNGADNLIITHGDFKEAIQPLAAHRAGQGLRVQVVDVQDVYDEFGYGLMSAEAIRDFLAFAYSQWQGPAPSHVLLVGDGTYDFRRYLATSMPTYLPPYLEMVDPDLGETATDNRFVAVSGNDILPDMNIGRLPANSAAEATAMVNKIIGYETSTSDGWHRNVLFVSDDLQGGGGNFYEFSDGIADGYCDPPTNSIKCLPAPYKANKVYLGRTCTLENPSVICRQQILNHLNETGALLVSYIGHGTKTYWAEERLMDIAGLNGLTNSGKLPVLLPMTCDEGYFIQPNEDSLGEASVRQPGVGAVASWSPTGFGLATGHDLLEKGLFLSIFHGGTNRLGAATTQSKLYLAAHAAPGQYADLIDTFLLLGDPALRLKTEPVKRSLYLPLITHRR